MTDTLSRQEKIEPPSQSWEVLPVTEQLEKLGVTPEVIFDAEGFERNRYEIAPGVNVVLRGIEEVPTLVDMQATTALAPITLDQRPQHTSGDRFGQWLAETTEMDMSGDPFERAGDRDVAYIAPTTALGIIDVALTLQEYGYGDVSDRGELQSLRRSVKDSAYTDEAIRLFDAMFSASFEYAEFDPSSWAAPETAPYLSPGWQGEEGLMLVALALAGDESAQKAVQDRIEMVDRAYSESIMRERGEGTKLPGEVLDSDEIKTMRDAGLIAVHTSRSMPAGWGQAPEDSMVGGVIYPTSMYERGRPGTEFQRSTIHFSLNHTVSSHMFGNFEGRQFTIVSPLADMAEINGAPTVLNGVDTYYTVFGPDGLKLPKESYLIRLVSGEATPYINLDQNTLNLADRPMSPDDFNETFSTLKELCVIETEVSGMELSDDSVKKSLIEEILHSSPSVKIDTVMHRWHDAGSPDIREWFASELAADLSGEMLPDEQEYRATIKMFDLLDDYDLKDPHKVKIRTIAGAIREKYLQMSSKEVAANSEIGAVLSSRMRTFMVSKLVEKMGGKPVTGGSHYVFDSEWQDNNEVATAKKIGLRQDLHGNMPAESLLESGLYSARQRATTKEYDPETGEELSLDYDWTKYDTTKEWYEALANSPQARWMIISRDLLSWTRKPEDPEPENPWV